MSGPIAASDDRRFRSLDKNDAAMLFIDHQVGTMLFGIDDLDPVNLLNNTMMLAEGAKIFGLPCVLTTSNPTGVNGPLYKDLTDMLPDAPVIDRTIINAWQDPAFVDAVRATGKSQLIMAGVTSDVCLTFPAVAAVGAGFDVWGVLDASGSVSDHALYAAMFRMTQAGVKLADAGSVLAELVRDWASDEGPALGELFGRRQPNSSLIAQRLAAVTGS